MSYRILSGMLLILLAVTAVAQEEQPRPPADASEEALQPAGAYVIPIRGEISPSLVAYLRRTVDEARAASPQYVIFEVDTFGGRVDSALQITTLIGSLTNVPTVAYVTADPTGTGVSWSAGALISMACDRIYMAPGTSMGAAAPVFQTAEGGMEMAPEKTVSAVRTQMAALAEKNGYPEEIAVAMVDQEVELFEVFVDGELQVATAASFPSLERSAEDAGQTVERGAVISASGKLLSLTAGDMERYGVSSGTLPSLSALYEHLGVPEWEVTRVQETAADEAVALITSAGFTSLLILAGLIALFLEITSPGFGVPGTIAIACFAVLFASNFLLGTVGSLELLLFLAGLLLLVLEIFVIPGFGAAGISGIALIVFSLVLSMQDFVLPDFRWQWDLLHRNVLLVLGNVVGAFVAFFAIAHFVRRTPLFGRIALLGTQDTSEGYTVQTADNEVRYVGKAGFAVTTLRPSGKAEIDDEVVPVEADGEFIPAGTEIEVTRVNGNRVIVRKR